MEQDPNTKLSVKMLLTHQKMKLYLRLSLSSLLFLMSTMFEILALAGKSTFSQITLTVHTCFRSQGARLIRVTISDTHTHIHIFRYLKKLKNVMEADNFMKNSFAE